MQNKNGKLSNLNVKCIIRSYEIIQNVKLKDVYYLYCKFKVDNFMRFSWFLYTGARAGMVGNCINGTNAGLHADLSLYSLHPLHARDCSSTKNWKPCCVWLSLVMKLLQNIWYLVRTRRYQASHTDHCHWGRQGDNFVACVVSSVYRHVLGKCYGVFGFGINNVIMIWAHLQSCDIYQ